MNSPGDCWNDFDRYPGENPPKIIQSQFIGRGVCNELINLSNEMNCTTANICLHYHCIYTLEEQGMCDVKPWSTCGCQWVKCWLWDDSNHQTTVKAVSAPPRPPTPPSISICRVLSEPVSSGELCRCDSWETLSSRHIMRCTWVFFFLKYALMMDGVMGALFNLTSICFVQAKTACAKSTNENRGNSLCCKCYRKSNIFF